MNKTHARTSDPLSQSSLGEYNSDIDDIGQDSDQGGGFDERMNLDNSDPIENISDDDFYNDGHHNSSSTHYFDDIESFTDDDDNNSTTQMNRPITRNNFKPFKALEGLDKWQPHLTKPLTTTTRHVYTNNGNDNDSIEGAYSDMDLDTAKASSLPMNDQSLDSIRSASASLSPLPPSHDSINHRNDKSSSIVNSPVSSYPNFSSYQTKTQDTQPNSHTVKKPAFILDRTTNKSHLPIKKDGLASMALDCVNQEIGKFREWQSLVLAEMAKCGSVTKVCMQDPQARICRILEMWVEHDMVFSWCVDLTIEEREQLLKATGNSSPQQPQHYLNPDDDDDNDNDDMMIIQDSDTGVSLSQPPHSLPTYEPNDDDRPYVCVFATTYLNGPRKNIFSKLLMAQYIAIWPPWTMVPISVDGTDLHIHIVTRFMMDDSHSW